LVFGGIQRLMQPSYSFMLL